MSLNKGSKYKINVNQLGKIMNEIYKSARMIDNITWFVNNEDFATGIYTQEDLDRFNQDIDTIKNHLNDEKDIEGIFEVCDKYDPGVEPVAIIHGAFLCLVSDKDDELQTLKLLLGVVELSYQTMEEDEIENLEKELLHKDFKDYFPLINKCLNSDIIFDKLSIPILKEIESVLAKRDILMGIKKNRHFSSLDETTISYQDYNEKIREGNVDYELSHINSTSEVQWALGKIDPLSFVEWANNAYKENTALDEQ